MHSGDFKLLPVTGLKAIIVKSVGFCTLEFISSAAPRSGWGFSCIRKKKDQKSTTASHHTTQSGRAQPIQGDCIILSSIQPRCPYVRPRVKARHAGKRLSSRHSEDKHQRIGSSRLSLAIYIQVLGKTELNETPSQMSIKQRKAQTQASKWQCTPVSSALRS